MQMLLVGNGFVPNSRNVVTEKSIGGPCRRFGRPITSFRSLRAVGAAGSKTIGRFAFVAIAARPASFAHGCADRARLHSLALRAHLQDLGKARALELAATTTAGLPDAGAMTITTADEHRE